MHEFAGSFCKYWLGSRCCRRSRAFRPFIRIHVDLTFIDIAIAELAPHYMRGYGPVSEEGAADLNGIVAELQSAIKELTRYMLQPRGGRSARKSSEAGEPGMGCWRTAAWRKSSTGTG